MQQRRLCPLIKYNLGIFSCVKTMQAGEKVRVRINASIRGVHEGGWIGKFTHTQAHSKKSLPFHFPTPPHIIRPLSETGTCVILLFFRKRKTEVCQSVVFSQRERERERVSAINHYTHTQTNRRVSIMMRVVGVTRRSRDFLRRKWRMLSSSASNYPEHEVIRMPPYLRP